MGLKELILKNLQITEHEIEILNYEALQMIRKTNERPDLRPAFYCLPD